MILASEAIEIGTFGMLSQAYPVVKLRRADAAHLAAKVATSVGRALVSPLGIAQRVSPLTATPDQPELDSRCCRVFAIDVKCLDEMKRNSIFRFHMKPGEPVLLCVCTGPQQSTRHRSTFTHAKGL